MADVTKDDLPFTPLERALKTVLGLRGAKVVAREDGVLISRLGREDSLTTAGLLESALLEVEKELGYAYFEED